MTQLKLSKVKREGSSKLSKNKLKNSQRKKAKSSRNTSMQKTKKALKYNKYNKVKKYGHYKKAVKYLTPQAFPSEDSNLHQTKPRKNIKDFKKQYLSKDKFI